MNVVGQNSLDDNKKGWLVVGICLHTILSPALRTFVQSVLTQFYNDLKASYQIHIQSSTNFLQRYPSTNTLLRYQNINNNDGRQPSQYDFKVRNPVDLSKLFLLTHMAHYTGFNDSCDSSALLGLVVNIDKFPSTVQSDALHVCTCKN